MPMDRARDCASWTRSTVHTEDFVLPNHSAAMLFFSTVFAATPLLRCNSTDFFNEWDAKRFLIREFMAGFGSFGKRTTNVRSWWKIRGLCLLKCLRVNTGEMPYCWYFEDEREKWRIYCFHMVCLVISNIRNVCTKRLI